MVEPIKLYYEKRGPVLVKNLQSRGFEAYYCSDREDALKKALSLIPEGASVGFGGAMSAEQIGLLDVIRTGNYAVIDRDTAKSPEERMQLMKKCLTADVFIAGANAISMDGQMVNIDGVGNRLSGIIFGPDSVLIIAGMNKIMDTLDAAITRARTVAAPQNKQRFPGAQTPCGVTGTCADCKSPDSICNQILITRRGKPAGRIKFILVGEELGL